jgi:hypothetical protein
MQHYNSHLTRELSQGEISNVNAGNSDFFTAGATGGAMGGLLATGTAVGAATGSAIGLAAAGFGYLSYSITTALGGGRLGSKFAVIVYDMTH